MATISQVRGLAGKVVGANPAAEQSGLPDSAKRLMGLAGQIVGANPNPGTQSATPSNSFSDYLTKNPGAKDAWAYLESLLNDYGLGSLSDFAKDAIVQGYSENETLQRLRATTEYKTRFAAIEQRKAQGLAPISEADVINNEKSYENVLASFGVPKGFYDSTEDYTDFLVKDVSPQELQERLQNGYTVAANADPAVKQALQQQYGLTEGDFLAYFIDPKKTETLLMKQVAAAQVGGAAIRSGFGSLTAQQAEQLNAFGVTGDNSASDFGALASEKQLFSGLPGQAEDDINHSDQLSAVFGKNADQQQRIKNRVQQRVAQFGGGGGFANSQTGASGLGTAR